MFTRSTMKKLSAVAATVVLGVGVASCSGDGDDSGSGTTPSAATTTTTTTVAAGSPGGNTEDIAVGEPAPGGGGGGNDGGGAGGGDNGGGESPGDDRCTEDALRQAYGDGPGEFVGVLYCDGDWAVSEGPDVFQNRIFMHRDHGWVGFAADGVREVDGNACYTEELLLQLGGTPDALGYLTWCDGGQPPEVCSLESLHESTGLEMLDVLMYCDGAWMRAGQYATDHVRNFSWSGTMWVEYVADGRSEPTGYPCYSWGRLIADGVPPALRDQLTVCT
ncbi:MAG TPA: hypothetical protein H9870_03105 [Candidatus Corynebacterium avicola]|uniref:Uncharacterized protein n=1 Tax=Candidatus Corynebacterium avicola TaxID=2838527 RepID=A0A9D1RPW9_9CORY|nr:hypothetical protein [Candidatus Corynebacterium avicola]